MAGFEPIKETLDRTSRRGPMRGPLLAIQVEKACRKFLPDWAEMISFKEGRLTVSAPSSAHSSELYLQSRELQKKVNEELGGKTVKEIRYRTTPAGERA